MRTLMFVRVGWLVGCLALILPRVLIAGEEEGAGWKNVIAVGAYYGFGKFPSYSIDQSFLSEPPDTSLDYTYPFVPPLGHCASVSWYRKGTLAWLPAGGLVHGASTCSHHRTDIVDRYMEVTSGLFWASRGHFLSSLQLGAGLHGRAMSAPTVAGYYDPYWTGEVTGEGLAEAAIDATMAVLFYPYGEDFVDTKKNSQAVVDGSVRGIMPHVSAHWELDLKSKKTRGLFVGLYADARYDFLPVKGTLVVHLTDHEHNVSWDEQWDFTSDRLMYEFGALAGLLFR